MQSIPYCIRIFLLFNFQKIHFRFSGGFLDIDIETIINIALKLQ